MIKILLTLVHVIVSVILVLVVLLQTGKRADLAGAFGGGGSQTAFGARGAATLLSKATTVCAVMFMITSLGLSIITATGRDSGTTVLEDLPAPASTAPVTPDTGTDDGPAEVLPELPAPEGDASSGEADPVTVPEGTPLDETEPTE